MEPEKKKFPKWVIALLVIFGVFVMGLIVVGFGVNYFLGGKRGEDLAKKAAGKFFEEIVERASDGKADVKINIDEKEPSMPSDFPSDIGVFQPSQFKAHAQLMGIRTFSWETEKPMQEVAKFYQDKMNAAGWQATTNRMPSEEGYFASFKKGSREVTVQVGKEEGKTVFNILYGTP